MFQLKHKVKLEISKISVTFSLAIPLVKGLYLAIVGNLTCIHHNENLRDAEVKITKVCANSIPVFQKNIPKKSWQEKGILIQL